MVRNAVASTRKAKAVQAAQKIQLRQAHDFATAFIASRHPAHGQ
jgi:hypothetical protein